jgi:hypothetical protein
VLQLPESDFDLANVLLARYDMWLGQNAKEMQAKETKKYIKNTSVFLCRYIKLIWSPN